MACFCVHVQNARVRSLCAARGPFTLLTQVHSSPIPPCLFVCRRLGASPLVRSASYLGLVAAGPAKAPFFLVPCLYLFIFCFVTELSPNRSCSLVLSVVMPLFVCHCHRTAGLVNEVSMPGSGHKVGMGAGVGCGWASIQTVSSVAFSSGLRPRTRSYPLGFDRPTC